MGILDASPNVLARMLQHDDLQVGVGTPDALTQNLEDPPRGDQIFGSGFPQRVDVFVQSVASELAAWEVDLARLVDHQEAERRQLQVFFL